MAMRARHRHFVPDDGFISREAPEHQPEKSLGSRARLAEMVTYGPRKAERPSTLETLRRDTWLVNDDHNTDPVRRETWQSLGSRHGGPHSSRQDRHSGVGFPDRTLSLHPPERGANLFPSDNEATYHPTQLHTSRFSPT
jgi:hypothetical protein